MAYTAQQLNTAREIIAVGLSMNATRREIKSALETGLMESSLDPNAKNQWGFVGWRQEHPKFYGRFNRRDPRGQARRYFREARAVRGRGLKSYQIAAAVQRPEPSARGKYAQFAGQAGALLRQLGGAGGGGGASRGPASGGSGGSASSRVVPGKTTVDIDAALIDALISGKKSPVTRALHAVGEGLYTSTSPDRIVQAAQDEGATVPRYGKGRAKLGPGADRQGMRTKPKVLSFVSQIAQMVGEDLTIGTGTRHSRMTVDGNVSQHWTGDAADVPAAGRRLIRLGQAALIAAGMDPAQARKQRGGLYNVGRYQIIFNTHEGGDHTDHLHVGVR